MRPSAVLYNVDVSHWPARNRQRPAPELNRPTLYATFGQGYFLSAAWNVQVWGAVAGSSGALDLANFERHQAKLRVGVAF